MHSRGNSVSSAVSVNLLNVTIFSRLFRNYDRIFMFVKVIAPKGQREAIAEVTLNL
jgi:hypothetical protein